MGFWDSINEQIYSLFSMKYYEVFLYKNKIQVGRIIQLVSFSQKFIVDKNRKLAYLIDKDCIFVKGNKLILHYNIDFGLPLKEVTEIEVNEVNENITKTKQVKKLVGSFDKDIISKSTAIKLTEENLPPSLIFEIFNAHFVVKVLSPPKSTDWGMVILAITVAAVIIAFMAIMVFGLK